MSIRPVRPDRFPRIILGTDVRNGVEFGMLVNNAPLAELIIFRSRSFDCPISGAILTHWSGPNVVFPGNFARTYGISGQQFGMLIHPDHIQNWVDIGCTLLSFIMLLNFSWREIRHNCVYNHYPDDVLRLKCRLCFQIDSGNVYVKGKRRLICLNFCTVQNQTFLITSIEIHWLILSLHWYIVVQDMAV